MTKREDRSAKGVEKSRMSEVFLSPLPPLCCGGDIVFVKLTELNMKKDGLLYANETSLNST